MSGNVLVTQGDALGSIRSYEERVYRLVGERIRNDAYGAKQVAFIGAINPQSLRVETPEEVYNDIVRAAKDLSSDQLGATDDCGFSPFSIDVKPEHGSPDVAPDIAFQKIANRIKGAAMASVRLGIWPRAAAAVAIRADGTIEFRENQGATSSCWPDASRHGRRAIWQSARAEMCRNLTQYWPSAEDCRALQIAADVSPDRAGIHRDTSAARPDDDRHNGINPGWRA
jgi:hypothetical protein